ncbi:MAG: hypothetical protein HS132_08575 [Planctomycetia bacterium]|nr:hypothetical protein [Planctomycetia bacterium]
MKDIHMEPEISDFSKFSKVNWKTYTDGEYISQWAVLRNIVAHEYLDSRWNTIKKFIQTAEPICVILIQKTESILQARE